MTADTRNAVPRPDVPGLTGVLPAPGHGTPAALGMDMTHLDAIATRNRNPVTFDLVVLVMMLNALLLLALIVTP